MGDSEQEHAYAPVPPSEASTQEDPSFGYELSREIEVSTQEDLSLGYELFQETDASTQEDPSFGYELSRETHGANSVMTVSSVHTLNSVIASVVPADPNPRQYHLESAVFDTVGEPLGRCRMEGEDVVSVDSEFPRRSLERLESGIGVENAQPSKYEQEMTDCSVSSFTLPDPDALSTLSSNASGGRRFRVAQPEAFATQEQLQLPRSSGGFEDAMQSSERPRQSSAVIQFAFPGLYQALVDQWVEQGCESGQVPSSEGTMTANAALDAEKKTSDQTSPAAHLTSVGNITSQHACHAHPGTAGVLSHGYQPALDECMVLQSPRDFSVGFGGHYGGSELAQAPSVPLQAPERRHSFGLHISLRNVSITSLKFTLSMTDSSNRPMTVETTSTS